MSFRCGICNKAQETGTPPIMLVIEQRRVNYPQRMKGKKVIDPGGSGWEIARAVNACAKCADKNDE